MGGADIVRLDVTRQSSMAKRQSDVCRRCGGPKPLGDRCPACKAACKKAHPEKARAATRKWRAKNPEKVRAYSAAHRQEVREAGRRWDKAHKSERAAQSARRANTPEFRARRRAWYAANAERLCGYSKKWRLAHPEQAKAIWRAAAIRHHGLTLAQYEALLDAQGGVCGICEAREPGGHGTWHIDHDHGCCPRKDRSCGRCVRGLLCNGCNLGLGKFRDNTETLRRAIAYLETSRGLRALAG